MAMQLNPMTIQEAHQALQHIGADPVMRHDREGHEYWLHRCAHPDHDDSDPSATITLGTDGSLLLNCFGCAPSNGTRGRWVAQIVQRLRDGTPKPPPDPTRTRRSSNRGGSGHGVKTAHYTYTDPDGVIVARKVRFEPKSFLWQRPHGEHWAEGLRGKPLHELPLYGLHSIPDAPSTVFIVEGEKDADRLHALGIPAVCAAGSHPRNLPEDLSALHGHQLIVVADRDPVGITLARAWQQRLPGAILAQPKPSHRGADISDHLDAGWTLQQLDFGPIPQPEPEPDTQPTREEDANPRGWITWTTLWRADHEDRDYLIPDILPCGAVSCVYSAPGIGKSLLGLEWATMLSLGRPLLGEPCQPRTVIYLDHENDEHLLCERLEALGLAGMDLPQLHYSLLGDWQPLDTAAGGRELLDTARDLGAELIIIDTTSRVISGGENDADTFHRLYKHTLAPLKSIGIASLRLDHAGKDTARGERGSSAKRGDTDITYRLTASGANAVTLTREKNRLHIPGPSDIALRRHTDPLRHERVTIDLRHATAVAELVDLLDRLGVPADAGRPVCARALREHGHKVRNDVLGVAVRQRKKRS